MRALELNSWQLLRLLQAQLSGLPCENVLVEDNTGDTKSVVTECGGNRSSVAYIGMLPSSTGPGSSRGSPCNNSLKHHRFKYLMNVT